MTRAAPAASGFFLDVRDPITIVLRAGTSTHADFESTLGSTLQYSKVPVGTVPNMI
ncbi:MAG: hypothetical protein ACR2OY_02275 [Boseongicola sp.]